MPPSARQGKAFHCNPEDGDIRFHQNVSVHVTDCTASDPEDLNAGHHDSCQRDQNCTAVLT